MTSKEKKDRIVQEVIIPELQNAGYQFFGQTFYCFGDDCCIALKLQNSQFNSENAGYSFRFHIKVFPKDISLDALKDWSVWSDSIHEDVLLPDCGYLHPYRDGKGYHIDGYKNSIPQDIDLTNIEERIGSDLRNYILPQLSGIRTPAAWKSYKKEWLNRWNAPKVLLMNYFNTVQLFATEEDNLPHLRDAQRRLGLSAKTIRENRGLYLQIKDASIWPEDDKWEFILHSLLE